MTRKIYELNKAIILIAEHRQREVLSMLQCGHKFEVEPGTAGLIHHGHKEVFRCRACGFSTGDPALNFYTRNEKDILGEIARGAYEKL